MLRSDQCSTCPGYRCDRTAKRRHCSGTSNHWHIQRQIEPDRYSRRFDPALRSFMFWFLAACYLFRTHRIFCNPLQGLLLEFSGWSVRIPPSFVFRCTRADTATQRLLVHFASKLLGSRTAVAVVSILGSNDNTSLRNVRVLPRPSSSLKLMT